MIKSMTGFGRAEYQGESKNFNIEIKSVNHRYLDINIRMPKNLLPLEQNIRKTIGKKIKRGKIDVYISQNIYESNNVEAIFNKPLADSYVKCLNNIKNLYKANDDISVSLIAKLNDVISIQYKDEDIEKLWNELLSPLNKSINLLIDMREEEGEKLYNDFMKRCNLIDSLVNNLKNKAPLLPKIYKDKLEERIKNLIENVSIDENRIALEVALYADKCCVNEEVVRLKSHINQFIQTLKMDESVGRKLDFIVQEMNREINTIASKANDLEISKLVLDIKSEIEKIREQVQNIE